MNLELFAYVIVVLALCGFSAETYDIRGRIVNGQDAADGEFKFMAFLVADEVHCCGIITYEGYCGGAIIAANWVLTAAHCVYRMVRINVYLGLAVAEGISTSYKVPEDFFFPHPAFSFTQKINDIALIQIPRTMECDTIRYARLPLNSSDFPYHMFEKKTALIMGWGLKRNKGELSEKLQKAKVYVMTTKKCQEIIPSITKMELCTRTRKPFISICDGDSGGPLVLEESGELIGIASAMTSDCENGDVNIFMRATSYLPWIIQTIGRIKY